MTNDDRDHDDRTAGGQTPSWGQPQGETPRYGERITPASAPQYGEQAPQQQYGEQPRYGEQAPQQHDGQPQYGQQQYGQQHQPAQQPYAQQPYAGAPAWQAHDDARPKKKTVGRIALVVAFIALVLGVIGGYVLGNALGSSGVMGGLLDGSTTGADQQQLQDEIANNPAVESQLATGGILMGVGTLFGLWAIVQGIVAIATKRGRGWGVFALVLAVVAAIVAFVVYIGVAVATSGAAS